MKMLVVSDNHGWNSILSDLKQRYAGKVSVMIHCGDSEMRATEPEVVGYTIVRGNCDDEDKFPNDILESVEDCRVFVTHGHRYNIKMTLTNLAMKAKETGADFVFFGHSHTPGAEMEDGVLYLNPGSISLPRGRREKTYAIVDVSKSAISVQFYDDTHQEVKELSCTFSR
ncbi:metallophosphoesterase [Domibacillus sp. DTU_2020_1001157_1_SI_ALB_TIR_016]|uniref:metallophosphoesterase n=1 Tax=Domibacillus sp. DTU_2020_1001157_1_SI_ALB_TIR_016 TaxID=3077789 RepID=UPI0028EB208E|nr:metallophosphoesterase [Domibacillus sp. DTU_2020_1001157_1_SI_ALB_TIR_016]WNS81787.1 metallophosphoesterase [Domibacillus sp. DTU_2020_1001157_1_SI_ALB_TIR_016]